MLERYHWVWFGAGVLPLDLAIVDFIELLQGLVAESQVDLEHLDLVQGLLLEQRA